MTHTSKRAQSSARWRTSKRTTTNTPPRILLAEDDDDMRDIIAEMLAFSGYEVVSVSDGGRLLVRIAGTYASERTYEEFDLIVSDIRMPVCDGLHVIEELRKALWPTPVILMTAHVDERTRARAEALDAVLFEKPFDADDLRRAALKLTSALSRP